MQCGSTGLGKVALKMRLEDKSKMTKLPPTNPPDGSLVMYCKTYDPVVWNVWIGLEPEDIGALIRVTFRKDTLVFAFKALFKMLFGRKKDEKDMETVVQAQAVKETA